MRSSCTRTGTRVRPCLFDTRPRTHACAHTPPRCMYPYLMGKRVRESFLGSAPGAERSRAYRRTQPSPGTNQQRCHGWGIPSVPCRGGLCRAGPCGAERGSPARGGSSSNRGMGRGRMDPAAGAGGCPAIGSQSSFPNAARADDCRAGKSLMRSNGFK